MSTLAVTTNSTTSATSSGHQRRSRRQAPPRQTADSGGAAADQRGALAVVAESPFGDALLVALAVGLACYSLWRIAQGLLDTDDKGDDEKGWAVRASKVGSGIAYGILFFSALGILMRDKDGFAQKKLLDGLKDPAKALVPPEKALQLLSYDVHADAYEVARDIVKKPPNDDAKREALRLLAADACCATRRSCARTGRLRPRRCILSTPASCSSKRARSCSTSRTMTTSGPPAWSRCSSSATTRRLEKTRRC